MGKKLTPIAMVGWLVIVAVLVTDRFITEVPDRIVFPVLALGLILVFMGRRKKSV